MGQVADIVVDKFSLRMELVIKYYHHSINSMSKALSINQSGLSKVVKENSSPRITLLQSLHKAYADVNIDWLITGRGEMLFSESYNNGGEASALSEPIPEYGGANHECVDIIEMYEQRVKSLNMLISSQNLEIKMLKKGRL